MGWRCGCRSCRASKRVCPCPAVFFLLMLLLLRLTFYLPLRLRWTRDCVASGSMMLMVDSAQKLHNVTRDVDLETPFNGNFINCTIYHDVSDQIAWASLLLTGRCSAVDHVRIWSMGDETPRLGTKEVHLPMRLQELPRHYHMPSF